MSLSIVTGSSGSGKSTYVYQHIISEAMAHKDRNYLVIVPEQYTMATQRMLVMMHPKHCIMNIDALSFNRLAYRVFEELGIPAGNVLDDMGKSLVLRHLVTDHLDELKALKKNITRITYIAQVKSLISEMTQYNITPDVLREMINYGPMSQNFRLKATDLLIMYETFLQFIDGKYLTTESILSRLNECLDSSEMVQGATVVLDGFTGFTPIQYQLLQNMLSLSQEVIVTITADSPQGLMTSTRDDDLFAMSAEFMQSLMRVAKAAGVEISDTIHIDGSAGRLKDNMVLKHLSDNIFRDQQPVYNGSMKAAEALSLMTFKGPREELTYAAICIRQMIAAGGYRFKDFAIVCPDLEKYRYLLPTVFKDYDIDYFIDAKTELVYHPFVEAIDAIFDMYELNFKRDAVFRFLRAGFTDLTNEEIDTLENYVYATGIRGRAKYFHPFVIKANSFCQDEQLLMLNAIRERFVKPLMTFDEVLKRKDVTVETIARGLYELLCTYDCQSKIATAGERHQEAGHAVKAKEYDQLYRIIMDLMDKLVSIIGDEPMDIAEFRDVFDAGLSAASIGVIPPANDSVIIGDMERTRLDDIRVMFLLGASDDAIPKKVENGGILSQLEREQLLEKFVLAPSDRQRSFRQRFYLYMMLSKPSERLIITAPRMNGDGKAVRNSYLMENIRNMFDLTVDNVEEFTLEQQLISRRAALNLMLDLIKKAAESGHEALEPDELELLDRLLAWTIESGSADPLYYIETAFRQQESGLVSEEIMEAVNEAFNEDEIVAGSVSKFETYASCAYKYFLTYVLGLREREEFELSAIDMGNFYHECLEHYGRLLKEDGLAWTSISEDQRGIYIDTAVRLSFEHMGKVATLEDPTQTYIVDTMKGTIAHCIDIMTEQLRRGTFEPELFEQRFEESLTDVSSGEPMARLVGKVDRIDLSTNDDGAVRIIDYKSSARKLDLSACYYGLSLQLPIYMGAVLQKLQERMPGVALHPSAMLYFSTKNPFIKDPVPGVSLAETRLQQLRMDGLVSDDPDDLFCNDKNLTGAGTKSAIVNVDITNKGAVSANSSTIPPEGFQVLMDYSRYKAARLAQDIIDGKFPVNPRKYGKTDACVYCDYKTVCHNKEVAELPKVEDALQQMVQAMKKE